MDCSSPRGVARVLGGDDVRGGQRFLCARAQIAQVSDRSGDDIEPAPRIAHYNSRLRCTDVQPSASYRARQAKRRFNPCRICAGILYDGLPCPG